MSSSASDISFKENFHAKMSSPKPSHQISALKKILNILKAYQGKDLNEIDKQLIKGIYLRNNDTYKHLHQSGKEVDDEEEW